MTFDRLPDELKQRVQWCCWRYEKVEGSSKPTKVPYNPRTGHKASSTNAQTWCSFDEAVAAAQDQAKWAGTGFFFTSFDEYTGIDLDDPYAVEDDGTPKYDPEKQRQIAERHQKILSAFNSYSEASPSKTGVHIIVKGKVPRGRRRDAVEIYSQDRFFTMTGDVIINEPITGNQEILTTLWEEIGPQKNENEGGTYLGNPDQLYEDLQVFEMASKAANGDKFLDLYNGDYQKHYNSQSEADYALIDIIAYYTENRMQIARMFRDSALGSRDKAKRENYVIPMINKSFDNKIAPFDISGIVDSIEARKAAAHTPTPSASAAPAFATANGSRAHEMSGSEGSAASGPLHYNPSLWYSEKPAGYIGMIADYIYRASPRPVREISTVAALSMFAGIVGRQYNYSKTGLNLYLMMIAETGMGKEAMASGMSKIVSAIAPTQPAIQELRGPAEMASGQALLKFLANREHNPCFVSLMGEFGIRLKQITDPNAASADKTLLRVLLDLFTKSQAGVSVEPSIYADKEKNTKSIYSPAVSLLGESTPGTFYEALDERSIATGLLPRMIIVEYRGERAPFNKAHEHAAVPEQLIQAIQVLVTAVHTDANHNIVKTVGHLPDAEEKMDLFRLYSDHNMMASKQEAIKQLWNRAHLKVLKIAALLAVSKNSQAPIIEIGMVDWAMSLVMSDIENIISRFDAGTMGEQNESDNAVQLERMKHVIKEYIEKPFYELPKYGAIERLKNDYILTHSYAFRAVCNNSSFKRDKRGTSAAVQATMKMMCEFGYLRELPINQLKQLHKYEGKSYGIVNPGYFLG